MKKLNIFIFALLSICILSSCNDVVTYNNDFTPADKMANTGTPVISGVYDVTDTECKYPLSTVEAGQMVHLVGKNLNNVQSIRFVTASPDFDAEADLSQIYTASNIANIVVPTSIGQKASKMVYTTDMGSVEYNVVVPFPELVVNTDTYLWNNNTLTIFGKYFDKYQFGKSQYSKVYVNGQEAEVANVTETSLEVTVDGSVTSAQTVKLEWVDGDGVTQTSEKTASPVTAAATATGLLYNDFSATQVVPSGFSVNKETADISGAQSLGRTYLHVTGDLAQWSWNTLDLSENMAIDITGDIKDYVISFELLTPEGAPLPAGSEPFFQFMFNWNDPMLTWYPGDGTGLNTHGQWVTVTLPLETVGDNISAKGVWQALRLVIKPCIDYSADFYMANFRIVKK